MGFFDSGIGGLTLLSECVRRMPEEKYIYLGDNTRAPYGNRPAEEIKNLAFEAFEKLSRYPLKAAVIACNTVTADAADALRESYSFPIVGVEPAVKPAAARGGKVLVLATKATAESVRFKKLCARSSGAAEIVIFSPEKLVDDIEKNIFSLDEISLDKHLPRMDCTGVVLGCTHYIFLAKYIAAFYGCPTYDGNVGAAQRLQALISSIGRDETVLLKGEKKEDPRKKTEEYKGRKEDKSLSQLSFQRGNLTDTASVTLQDLSFFDVKTGTADHFTKKANKCSKNIKKMPINQPIFIGAAKNKNKSVFLSLN